MKSPAGNADTFCLMAEPMRPAKGEARLLSPQLRLTVAKHNRLGEVYCGWRP